MDKGTKDDIVINKLVSRKAWINNSTVSYYLSS